MRRILSGLAVAVVFTVTGCGTTPGADGVAETAAVPETAAQQAAFAENGERVLLQGQPLDQRALDAAAASNEQKFAVQTAQGVFMMTRAQLNQYTATQRAIPATGSTVQSGGFGTVVSRTVISRPTSAAAQSSAPAPAVAQSTPAPKTTTKAVPGSFDRYVAASLNFTKGPKGFKNSDGTFDCVMTFDDGPHHNNDPKIYDILDQKGIKATFFFLGSKVATNPNTTKQAIARGHEVGYHSWDHKNLRAESLATVQADFKRGLEAFAAVGITPKFFRPPYGNYNTGVINTAKANGMEVVNWTNDSLDWKHKSASAITNQVLNNAAPGDIVLLHSLHSRSIDALPGIIDGLKAKGCRFTSLQSWARRATS